MSKSQCDCSTRVCTDHWIPLNELYKDRKFIVEDLYRMCHISDWMLAKGYSPNTQRAFDHHIELVITRLNYTLEAVQNEEEEQ